MKNWSIVFKQSFKSTFSKAMTWIVFGISFGIMAILLIAVPLIIIQVINEQSLQPTLIALTGGVLISLNVIFGVWTVILTTGGYEKAEMTFIISRPVSRNTYISAKSVCALTINSFLVIGYIILILVMQAIIQRQAGFNIFDTSGDTPNWTCIIPILLIWIFATFEAISLSPFFKKDSIVSLFVLLVIEIVYQGYTIGCVIARKTPTDGLWHYTLLPSIVFGALAIVTPLVAFLTFKRIKVTV